MAVARYDGHADWYDEWRRPHAASTAREVADLLGPGEGLCLDLGCGTGLFLDALAATGRAVVGLDRCGRPTADRLGRSAGSCRRMPPRCRSATSPSRRWLRYGFPLTWTTSGSCRLRLPGC